MGDGGNEGGAQVDRATIAREVIARIAAVAKVDAEDVHESDALALNLALGAELRRDLAEEYNAVIAAHHGDPVTLDDAGDLTTVKDAVDLVFHHVGGHDAEGDA